MEYDVAVEDVHDDWYTPDNGGVPASAATPWDAYDAIIQWCREKNVMPKTIFVGRSDRP